MQDPLHLEPNQVGIATMPTPRCDWWSADDVHCADRAEFELFAQWTEADFANFYACSEGHLNDLVAGARARTVDGLALSELKVLRLEWNGLL